MAFSTDEELTEALGHVSDGIFKVFIITKGGECVDPVLTHLSQMELLIIINWTSPFPF